MPYSALVYRLLISAPGDVSDGDIAVVAATVARWNVVYGQQFGAIVVPLHWRQHSAAEHGVRPQESLNAQLVAAADVVIALFWHRLGSDTGKAVSGTVEEVEEARAAGAYVGILRCTRDLPHSKVDSDQLKKLEEYFSSARPTSLILDYSDDAQLAQHVDALINRAVTRSGARAEAATEAAPTRSADVWPRIESSESVRTDPRGRVQTQRRWQLVLSNAGNEPARKVQFRLEAESEGEEVPEPIDAGQGLETLAPGGQAPYTLLVHLGTAGQARCVVTWEDSNGEHENVATVRLY